MKEMKLSYLYANQSESAIHKILSWSFDTDYKMMPINFQFSGKKLKDTLSRKENFIESLKDTELSFENIEPEDQSSIENYKKYVNELSNDLKNNLWIKLSDFIRYKNIREFGEYKLTESDCLKFLDFDASELYRNRVYIYINLRTHFQYQLILSSKENADHAVYIEIPLLRNDIYGKLTSICNNRNIEYSNDKMIAKSKNRFETSVKSIMLAIASENIYYSIDGSYYSPRNQFQITSSF